jgi:hypothetical protein
VGFDPEDIEAAFEELDARYLAGEAAAHVRTWSAIASGYAALNRHEVPPTTPDWVNIDHRRAIAFAPGELAAYMHATWDIAPDVNIHIEAVHRLSNRGAVVTHVAHGTSQEGFEAEWREINLLTVDGDAVNHCEMFDEADTDAALARFDELDRPAPQLENAATRTWARCVDACNRRDADGFLALSSTDGQLEDRRKGLRASHEGAERRRAAEAMCRTPESWHLAVEPIAIRGYRLGLTRERWRDTDEADRPIVVESLTLTEVTGDELAHHTEVFDPDDIDEAFAALDARYIAGEARDHSHTWSVIARAYAALNRHEMYPTTPNWVNIDHRRALAFAPGDLIAYVRASWTQIPDISFRIEAVHRLSDLGAVYTQVLKGASQQGFDAEWRLVQTMTVEGDLISRAEIFDEGDLDAALARFDELNHPSLQLENAATGARTRIADAFNHRDLDGFLANHPADGRYEDRRKGLRNEGPVGREFAHSLLFEASASWRLDLELVAVRGHRLALTRDRFRDTDEADRPIAIELLMLTEVNDDELISYSVVFDPDDIDAAFAELDALYLAGEAAAHAHTWSLVKEAYAGLNRHEYAATTPDWVNVHRRRLATIETGHLSGYIRASRDATPDARIHIEAVHRLSSLGAVVRRAVNGSSQDGFYAEWREIDVLTFEGALINRCEVFDEADLDAALARFDELSASAHQLENAAIRARARVADAYNRRDVEGFFALTGGRYEDRRKGLRDEGAADRNFAHAVLSETPTSWRLEIEPVAIRGDRLALSRETFRDADEVDQPITVELIVLTEVADAELVSYTVFFDPDDINGAIAELTARWIASGEVAHPEVVEAQQKVLAASNRHDWDAVSAANANATYVNHRQLPAGGDTIADHMSSTRMMATLIPDLTVEPAQILTHSALGLVTSVVLRGTSTEGLAIEIPVVLLSLSDGDHLTRIELFDPDQRDLALARFDELNRPA